MFNAFLLIFYLVSRFDNILSMNNLKTLRVIRFQIMCLFKWIIINIKIIDLLKKKTYFNTYLCRVKGHIFSQGIKLQRKKKLQIYSTWQMTLWILIWIVSDKTFVVIDHKFFYSHSWAFVLLTLFLSFLIGKTFDFFRMCVFPAGEICKMCNRFEKDCYKT